MGVHISAKDGFKFSLPVSQTRIISATGLDQTKMLHGATILCCSLNFNTQFGKHIVTLQKEKHLTTCTKLLIIPQTTSNTWSKMFYCFKNVFILWLRDAAVPNTSKTVTQPQGWGRLYFYTENLQTTRMSWTWKINSMKKWKYFRVDSSLPINNHTTSLQLPRHKKER